MDHSLRLLFFSVLLTLAACTKEEQLTILQDKYAPNVQDAKPATDDFTVTLNARALQTGERGEWKILEGDIVDQYVYLVDKNNPFSGFKGLPGQEYTLEWTHWDVAGKMTVLKTKVRIPPLIIEISEDTPPVFQTIRTFFVNPKYKGKWSFDQAYGYITSVSSNGSSDPPELRPTIELHGLAKTTYTVTYTHAYAGREYKFQKVITTGEYTEDEGLSELGISRGSVRALEDNSGHIIQLDLSASGASRMMYSERYGALRAFKYLRRLFLGGSNLDQIPNLFGDYYTELEELNMDPMGGDIVFPDNFGNLSKLKSLVVFPLHETTPNRTVKLPASFAKLKALESFAVNYIGNINFNGTLGELSSLRLLHAQMTNIPENIGNLKKLKHLDVSSRDAVFPQRLAECTALTFSRIAFLESSTGKITLPERIGDLQQLQSLEITAGSTFELPPSFMELSSLSSLNLMGLRSVPENFGNLAGLKTLTIRGTFTTLPANFGRLSRLTELFLGGRAEALPESFGDLSSLVYFNAEHSKLKTLPASISKLKALQEIALGSSQIEYLPESFAQLDGLGKLDLSVTQLKTFPKQIIPMKSISMVLLNGCNVGDIPDEIANMKAGVNFYLYGVPNLTYEHMMYIRSITKNMSFYTSIGFF